MATPMVTNLRKIDSSNLELANPRQYQQLIGSLMYLVNTRLEIYFVVNTLSQFMVEPREVHWVAAKHMLRYLQGIVGYGLQYLGGNGLSLQGVLRFKMGRQCWTHLPHLEGGGGGE
jgi:hypothetical protein